MPLSFGAAFSGRFAKVETFGNTFGDTGRFQPLVDPVHAVITFDRFSGFRVPLGGAPRAGGYACFAADTQCLLNENDAVFTSLLHCTGGTGSNTPGILAMETRHENV